MRRIAVLALLAPLLLIAPRPALARIDVDPRPPMAWEEMLACKLVVVARYERNEGTASLGLRVVEVLRGEGVATDQLLTVSLEHRYTLQTGPEGCAGEMVGAEREDGIPKLCYDAQLSNPGPACPYRIIPDVREPAIYFFPDAAAPALAVRNQVQPMRLAAGWRRAVAGARPDLAFRLLQRVDTRIAREALEELYVSRDPATIATIADMLRDPKTSAELGIPDLLVSIGDRSGDVYGPMLDMFLAESQEPDQWKATAPGYVLAQVDRERAVRDFTHVIATAPLAQKQLAASLVGLADTESALDLTLDLLDDPTFADAALRSLMRMLGENGGWGRPDLAPVPGAERWRLQQLAGPRLVAALPRSHADEELKRTAVAVLRDLFDQPIAVDLARAEKVLLDPNNPLYTGDNSNPDRDESQNLLDAIDRASDPVYVPLLVKILKTVPAAREGGVPWLRDALLHYARICRRAMRDEIARQGVDRLMGFSAQDRAGFASSLIRELGEARSRGDLQSRVMFTDYEPETIRRLAGPEIVAPLKEVVEAGLAEEYGPEPVNVELLLVLDPKAGASALARALAVPVTTKSGGRGDLLAIAVRAGHKELVGELIESVHAAIKRGGPNGLSWTIRGLLISGDPSAYAEYLKLLDGSRQDPDYDRMLVALFASHTADFLDRIEVLLASGELPDRQLGERLLEETLHWNVGFRSAALAPVRAAKIDEVRATFRVLGAMSVPQIRAEILRGRGVALAGVPGKAWIPALVEAASGLDPVAADNAIDLLGVVLDDDGFRFMENRRTVFDRARAVRALVADRSRK